MALIGLRNGLSVLHSGLSVDQAQVPALKLAIGHVQEDGTRTTAIFRFGLDANSGAELRELARMADDAWAEYHELLRVKGRD